jgi:hypothetical protein
MQIYIRRDNEEFGPYSREAVLEYVKQGVFEAADPACYAGMAEWKTVGELLGINGSGKTRRGAVPRSAAHITEFNPLELPEEPPILPERREKRPSRSGRGAMFALNVILVGIALMVGLMGTAPGRRGLRHGLLAMSAGLARLADAVGGDAGPVASAAKANVPSPAASSPAVTPTPVAVASPAQAASPIAAVTPAVSASPVTPATPVPALSGSIPAIAGSPAPAASPEASASPAMVAADSPPDQDTAAPAASATPTPPAAATPPANVPAPPKPFDPADLAGNPAAWPKQLRLRQAVKFPALYNGQVVGSVTAPAGTAVTLRNIQGGQLTVDYQGGTQTISWTITDLEQAAAKVAAAPVSTEAPATGMPPTSTMPFTSSAPPPSPGSTAPASPSPEAPSGSN